MMPAFHSLVGQRVERYDVLAQLGQGGFGAVYRARHRVLGTEAALKVLWPDRADDPQAVERFLREARAAASIGSPHIVRVIDAGSTPEGVVFLAMELLEGHDLERELMARRTLLVPEALDLMRQVLAALAAAHARGIVHRDLKPANVFLVPGPDGAPFVKLLDFGVSKVKGLKSLTASGVAIGTPQYMAPEQLSGARDLDGRTDVYAAGTMLYEMLAGRVPFEGAGVEALVRRLAGDKPPELRSLAPHVPPAIAAVVHRALAFDRDARFPSAEAMRDALLAAEEGVVLEAEVTVPPHARWVSPVSPAADPYAPTGETPVGVALASSPIAAPTTSSGVRPVSAPPVASGASVPAAPGAPPATVAPGTSGRLATAAPPPPTTTPSAPIGTAAPPHGGGAHPPHPGSSVPALPAAGSSIAPRPERRALIYGALGALAIVLAAGAGAAGVLVFRATREPPAFAPSAAPSRAPRNEPVPADPVAPPRSSPRAEPARPPPPIDPAGIRYRLVDVQGWGVRPEVEALLERARPEVARCAIGGRPMRLAIQFTATFGGSVTIAGPSPMRTSDDVDVARCVAQAIRDAGPMSFRGLQTAIVELDVDLPAE